MNNNIIDEFYKNISINTYNNISKSTFLTMLSSSFIDILSNNTAFYGYLDNVTYVCALLLCLLVFPKSNIKTKELIEIKNLYNEFLNNYKNLNDTFGNIEPYSIYKMYINTLYNGYLSKNKSFNLLDKDYNEFYSLFAINIFNGSGVCRHISSMLCDILNKSNIESYNLSCYLDDDSGVLLKIIGNHLITYANFNNMDYYLDATLRETYKRNGNYILNNHNNLKITSKKINIDNAFFKFSNYDKIYNPKLFECNNSLDDNIKIEIFKNVDKIFKENIDIFEKFYNENKEIYESISNKVLCIKKSMFNVI